MLLDLSLQARAEGARILMAGPAIARLPLSPESANLDLLRAVAVISVFISHVILRLHSGPDADYAEFWGYQLGWHLGQLGVLMFFVHTSLVLMHSLERRPNVTHFYVRRAFRIYPLAIVCVVVCYVWGTPLLNGTSKFWSLRTLLTNLTLTFNLTYDSPMVWSLWTLPIEVQMYVFLPILYLLLRDRPMITTLTACVVAVALAVAYPYISGRLQVLGFGPCFFGGILAWRLGARVRPKLNGALWPIALAAVAPVWMIASREHDMWYRWAFCLLLGASIPLFRDTTVTWLNSAAKTIAKYSYGIYLAHGTLIVLAFGWLRHWPAAAQWGFLAFGMVVVPYAMFHFIEQPMIDVGRRLTSLNRATPTRKPTGVFLDLGTQPGVSMRAEIVRHVPNS